MHMFIKNANELLRVHICAHGIQHGKNIISLT
jgi:hypothetical protein